MDGHAVKKYICCWFLGAAKSTSKQVKSFTFAAVRRIDAEDGTRSIRMGGIGTGEGRGMMENGLMRMMEHR